jgi:serine protease
MTLYAADDVLNPAFGVKTAPSSKGKPLYVEGEIVVKFHPNVPAHAIERFNQTHGATVIADLPYGITHLQLPDRVSPEAMAAVYERNPNVQFAHPNFIAYAAMIPDDYFYSVLPRHWNFDNPVNGGIAMEEAWDEGNAGSGVIVAVLDSGIAYEDYDETPVPGLEYIQATELALTLFVPGYDFINNDAHPNDDDGHGTHVAGTIAQSTNNGTGTAGVAFNASLMPVKVLDASGSGTSTALVSGIDFASQNGADVINMSLSFGDYTGTIAALEVAIQNAYDNGVVIVAASGNDYFANFVSYPANNPNVIAVGATDFSENVTDYSNKGPQIELTAPGGNVGQDLSASGYGNGGVLQQTLSNGNPLDIGYWYYEGTSMATPHVAAVAALVIEANPALTPGEVRTILRDSAEDHGTSGHDNAYGYGIVDAYQAVLLAKASLTPNQAPTAVISGDSSGVEDQPVNFSAVQSSDPDGDVLNYSWNVDGTVSSEVNTTHTFGWGGNFSVTLIVDDSRGGTDTDSRMITISEINDLPVIAIGGPYSGSIGVPVAFDAGGTTDYDNEDGSVSNDQTLSYSWDFGDGNTGSGVQTEHTYAAVGDYTVTLSVNDGVDTVVETVTVSVSSQPATVIEQVAVADIFIAGSIAGTYEATHGADGIVQELTERESGGRPSNRHAYLEHRWEFGVQPGDLVSLSAIASTTVGESFTFAYSTEGTAFTDMFSVTASANDYAFTLPNTLSGTLYIRVTDDTQLSGDRTLHTLAVDQIIIRIESSGSVTSPPSAPSALSAVATSYDTVALSWSDNADNESGFSIERSEDGSSWAEAGTTSANITTFTDTGLSATTLYHYRVSAFNSAGSSGSVETTVTTPDAPPPSPIDLSAEQIKVRAVKHVLLTWNNTTEADVIRDGVVIATTTEQQYEDILGKTVNDSYTYQVCESQSDICSDEVTVYY